MPSDVPRRALLAVFAHPDDEFAILPWLENGIQAGREVHVVWLTNGGWGGQSIERRQQESIAVLSDIGVRAANMHFLGAQLGIADGSLHEYVGQVVTSLLEVARDCGAVEIMIPAWEGGHQDHDAAHLVGLRVAHLAGAPAWEYSLYHGRGLPGALFTVLSLIPRDGEVEVLETGPATRLRCIAKCLRYRSQWKSFLGLLPVYIWRLRSTSAFRRRRADFGLTACRPHEGRLLYERRTPLSWGTFAGATRDFRAGSDRGESCGQR